MIESVKVENFRGIERLEIKGLRRVNLITGKNDCGKTTLLERVEGGDERAVWEAVAGETVWAGIHCWNAKGRHNLPDLARAAILAPNFGFARSVGVIMDVEESLDEAKELASRTLAP